MLVGEYVSFFSICMCVHVCVHVYTCVCVCMCGCMRVASRVCLPEACQQRIADIRVQHTSELAALQKDHEIQVVNFIRACVNVAVDLVSATYLLMMMRWQWQWHAQSCKSNSKLSRFSFS